MLKFKNSRLSTLISSLDDLKNTEKKLSQIKNKGIFIVFFKYYSICLLKFTIKLKFSVTYMNGQLKKQTIQLFK